jgi:hypothetical protein
MRLHLAGPRGALASPLARVLELPGKLRLTQEASFAVQPVYYPGFTIAGTKEPLGIIAIAAAGRVEGWPLKGASGGLLSSET